jgi:hypothetical protein
MGPFIVVNMWTRVLSDTPENFGPLPFPADPTLLVDGVTGEVRRLVVNDGILGLTPV